MSTGPLSCRDQSLIGEWKTERENIVVSERSEGGCSEDTEMDYWGVRANNATDRQTMENNMAVSEDRLRAFLAEVGSEDGEMPAAICERKPL